MITDKLLAFADGKAITASGNSDTIDLGKGGDEVARTLNVVAQIDAFGTSPTTTNTIAVALQGKNASDSWVDIVAFPAVSVSDVQGGARLVNFAKLPLGMRAYSALRLSVAVKKSDGTDGSLPDGTKYSAWLTPSAEA